MGKIDHHELTALLRDLRVATEAIDAVQWQIPDEGRWHDYRIELSLILEIFDNFTESVTNFAVSQYES